MKRFYLLLLISAIFFAYSCSRDEDIPFTTGFEAPVVHGIIAVNIMGQPQGIIGNPNTHTRDERLTLSGSPPFGERNLIMYPNPATDFISLGIQGDSGTIREIFIIKARSTLSNYNMQFTYLNSLFKNVNGSPLITFETYSEFLQLDLSSLEEGYYRVYVRIGKVILYDNLLILRNFNH